MLSCKQASAPWGLFFALLLSARRTFDKPTDQFPL